MARGVLAILFGLIAFLVPGITLASLIIVFGVWALLDGIFALYAAVSGQGDQKWWALLLRGIFGILAAGIAFFWPGITAVALVLVIGVWAIVSGIVEIVSAIRLRKQIQREWLLALAGVLSIIVGLLLVANPAAGALALLWVIAVYAIVLGGMYLWLGFKLRKRQREIESGARPGERPQAPPAGREQRAAD